MYDVISVGSATLDVFAKTESELIKIMTKDSEEELIAYPAGSKILIEALDFQTGGGGTNSAVAFARLGLKTAYLGNLGNDSNAKEVLRQLKNEKVHFIGTYGKEQTGYSIILDSIEEDRTILTYKGANNGLSFSNINKKKLKARWFYFSSMVGKSYKALEQLASFAKKTGINVAFNPSSYLTKKGLPFLGSLLKNTDVLILNREEAEMLAGAHSMESLPQKLSVFGPKTVVVTDGKNGVCAFHENRNYLLAANKVKVVETTGAGDAFASGFLVGLILKNDVKFALHLGMADATSVVMHLGAKNKLLSLQQAMRLAKKNHRINAL